MGGDGAQRAADGIEQRGRVEAGADMIDEAGDAAAGALDHFSAGGSHRRQADVEPAVGDCLAFVLPLHGGPSGREGSRDGCSGDR